MAKSKPMQYVILPAVGMTAEARPEMRFMSSLQSTFRAAGAKRLNVDAQSGAQLNVKVVDSIKENGAKLIECSPDEIPALRAAQPGMRIEPVVYYHPMRARFEIEEKLVFKARLGSKITLKIVAKTSGKAVKGALVVAFTNFAQRQGAQGTTNAQGKVTLALGASKKKIERLYVLVETALWPALLRNVTISNGQTIQLIDLDPNFTDCVRHFYPGSMLTTGAGVKVGVVDTGIATNHPNLVVEGGRNTVPGENPADFGDNGTGGHGSHCAGIIASRKAPLGVAPGVTLRAYRVFGKNEDGASNFAIAKAIDGAVEDGVDVLNMSLGGGSPDQLTQDAITNARENGLLIFAANGNDERQPVSFPAAFHFCQAVSAMGRVGTFPANTEPTGSVANPRGTDNKDFIADFSNVGDDTDYTGPGVGVISTVPGGIGVMSGTSMACPAEAGAAARVLSGQAAILAMPRNADRWAAMVAAVAAEAELMGFGPTFEGKGMIR